MNNKTDVGLINAHAECIGTYHYPHAALEPLLLPLGTH